MAGNQEDHRSEGKGGSEDRLLAAATVARSALEGQRSDRLLQLFEYLLERTLADQTPSEHQIASEAFLNGGAAGSAQDANVRVHVHRLRKLIDAAFANSRGPRIEIPVGEYRIRLVGDEPPSEPWPSRGILGSPRRRLAEWTSAAAAALAVLALAVYWYRIDEAPLARVLPWQQLDESERPITVVVGDYYLFGEIGEGTSNAAREPRLVWDRTVPTREDLTVYHILNPSAADSAIDFNQQFVSSGTVAALSHVRSALVQLPHLDGRDVQLVPSSQLTPEMLMASDIVYVGLFSGMDVLLRDPLLHASGFELEAELGGLIDRASGTRYRSEGMNLTDERIPRRDFGYLALLPGPAGNVILVIAGLGDAGLKEAAELARDPDRLGATGADPAKRERGFEALYRVRTIRNVNVGATLVTSRPLKSRGVWDRSADVPAYRPVEVASPHAERR